MVVGNFERALCGFTAQRLVTEGVLYVVALIATLMLLLSAEAEKPTGEPQPAVPSRAGFPLAATVAVGVTAAVLSIAADWAIVRAIYGDRFAGHAGLHIRFGPRATVNRVENRGEVPNR